MRPTIRYSLEVKVGLRALEIRTDEFKVDFVFDVGHQDERGDDTFSSA